MNPHHETYVTLPLDVIIQRLCTNYKAMRDQGNVDAANGIVQSYAEIFDMEWKTAKRAILWELGYV
jgi:hypothetical protein